MRLFSEKELEYLGKEERNGKNGNYYYLKFLDENMDCFRFFASPSSKFEIMPHQLKPRDSYKLIFDYVYDSYNNNYRFNLVNIVGIKG